MKWTDVKGKAMPHYSTRVQWLAFAKLWAAISKRDSGEK